MQDVLDGRNRVVSVGQDLGWFWLESCGLGRDSRECIGLSSHLSNIVNTSALLNRITMTSPLCLRCLRRSLQSIDHQRNAVLAQRAAFSTTSLLHAQSPATPKKKAVQAATSTTRTGKRLTLTKNTRQSTGRPPAPGERKAVRKRIVLSNTNALEVKGLQDFTFDKLVEQSKGKIPLESYRGQVLGFGNETVDALRALEAFKATQGWSLFRRPASLIRGETVEVANEMIKVTSESKRAARRVIFGEKGSGKSALLLQAHAMAHLKGWIVVHYPEAQDLVNAHTAFAPLNTSDGTLYVQPQYTANLLKNLAAANQSVLSTLRLSKQHNLPIPIQPNISLARFAEMGASDPELAYPIWQALWSELTTPSNAESQDGLQRPPFLVTMDGVDQAMRMSAYLDADVKPIHAHDLALVRDFMALLSGETSMPNGGMVMAATCQSNRGASPTLDHLLNLSIAQQDNSNLSANAEDRLEEPMYDPYAPKDTRVEAAMKGVQAMKLSGLSKDEAKGMMEYYAQSGILRDTVTDGLVSEKWTLAGSGIVGELEKGAVRMRF